MVTDMEREIRKAGGATDFNATISYKNTSTQIPSSYKVTYKINGKTKTLSTANAS